MPHGLALTHLRTENFVNPIGLGEPIPRFSWEVVSDLPSTLQTAYRVVVTSSPEILDEPNAWDSGWVDSDQSIHVEYAGHALISGQAAVWRVEIRDNHGRTAVSDLASFEIGLLDASDWSAEWIAGPLVGGPRTSSPVPYFRRDLDIEKPIGTARLYVTALGVYEVHLNGAKVGQDELRPGWTDYSKRLQVQTYDVTSQLKEGANAIGAIVGDGWYCGALGMWSRQMYGRKPAFLCQLVIDHPDGTTSRFTTDSTWKVAYGPLLEADLLMGEAYDARLEFGPWADAGFDDSAWWPVETLPSPDIRLVASASLPVRTLHEIKPIAPPKVSRSWQGAGMVFDLGQNMVGVVRLRIKGPAGTTIKIRHAEILDEKGNPYYANLRSARATDYYTLKGDPDGEEYSPRFTFHGFRYVELSGLIDEPTEDMVTGLVWYSETPLRGEFSCNDPLINQLQSNIQWGQRGNFLEVPTDCPQRDERLGWTGDAQVFIRTAAYNMDVAGFFTKWFDDVDDSQATEGEKVGAIPAVIPNLDIVGADGGPAWADAAVICPWTIYRCYGDVRVLQRHYGMMQGFLKFLEDSRVDGLRATTGWGGFGDWLNIQADTPTGLIGTAFLAYVSNLLARIADVLGKPEDRDHYLALEQTTREAFQHNYMTPAGLLTPGSQTSYVLALHFNLIPEELRANAINALAEDIRRRGDHLSTGFVGSPYLPHVLSECGRADVAYRLLHQTSWPSWLYAVTQGATTIWERWDGWTHDKGFQDVGMNSFNHYAYGAIGEWLYSKVAGIDLDPVIPGYKHIVLRPLPGGGLNQVKASFHSVYGPIRSEWTWSEGAFQWEVEIPANATATAHVPSDEGRQAIELGSGVHKFESKLSEAPTG